MHLLFQASRAQILKKAAEYISAMRRKSSIQSNDIDDLKRQNTNIEHQSESIAYFGWSGVALSVRFGQGRRDIYTTRR